MLKGIISFSLKNKLVVLVLALATLGFGVAVAPFDWDLGPVPQSRVPVDALPDLGENQQIVFTDWPGRSPQDMEDQVTYPLTVALMGIPKVKSVRSFSFFGFSTVYVIFDDGVEFYWSRSRVLEKLSSLPPRTLPEGVAPRLGPDATAMGQVFWYTLEGLDSDGKPAGGFDLQTLRSLQDFRVRYALQSVPGVAEVASIGGFEKEYQVDIDPDLLRHYDLSIEDVYTALSRSNTEVGARNLEINRVEYVIRTRGFVRSVKEIEDSVITQRNHVPIRMKDIAQVSEGPQPRRGALYKEGAEAVGGVVVVRYGENPLEVIARVKAQIAELAPTLPSTTLPDGRISTVAVVPFYDRTGLIHETLGTLEGALTDQMLVTAMVVLVLLWHLGSSIMISLLVPFAVLLTFVMMKLTGVDANLVALSGIAIAIGTMVDMGIVLTESILQKLSQDTENRPRFVLIREGALEVASAVATSLATTVISFLPVFTLQGAEGKLFVPLAFTKTYALLAALGVAIILIPPLSHLFLERKLPWRALRVVAAGLGIGAGLAVGLGWGLWIPAAALILVSAVHLVMEFLDSDWKNRVRPVVFVVLSVTVALMLAEHWRPGGFNTSFAVNAGLVLIPVGILLSGFLLFQYFYSRMLGWILRHKLLFLSVPFAVVVLGGLAWRGADTVLGPPPDPKSDETESQLATDFRTIFPGLEEDFMPPLDEGSYLLMPTTMAHASIGESLDVLRLQDERIRQIPEVKDVVGKLGRVGSPIDPAPISMFESVITYIPEYKSDESGNRLLFKIDADGEFLRDDAGELIPTKTGGRGYRQWRENIRTPDDIWKEIQSAAKIPGTTGAPKLQPIAARIVMLQSGMRAPMGLKIRGHSPEEIERVGLRIEEFLRGVRGVSADAVSADRIVGKPYLEIVPNDDALSRYGIRREEFMKTVELAIGGKTASVTVEGRERYPIRIRYPRELRDSLESLGDVLVTTADGASVPLREVAQIIYTKGPQVLKSEDSFLVGYVTFDKEDKYSEVEVVQRAKDGLEAEHKKFREAMAQKTLEKGEPLEPDEIEELPGINLENTSYTFAGNYENHIRANRTLMVVLPIALILIFLLLYVQFHRVSTTLMVFSGIFIAWSGGFLLLWLYGKPWFLDGSMFGISLRELFQVRPVDLTVAVWVGFLALFGIATDDGVVMATYLDQETKRLAPQTRQEVRAAVLEAGQRRIRACLMTTATTLLALLPVLTSRGRGADLMLPMALPVFGGMTLELLTMFVVPALYSGWQEWKVTRRRAS